MIQTLELIKHLGLGIVSLILLLHITMDEYGKAKDFLKTIQDVKSQYSQDSFEASVPDEFILSIATAETGNFKFEGADTARRANNYFGLQAIGNQPFILSQDPTKKAKVRAFDTPADSVKGFLELMKTGDNYQGVRDAIDRGDDVINYFDSNYISKVLKIRVSLYQYSFNSGKGASQNWWNIDKNNSPSIIIDLR